MRQREKEAGQALGGCSEALPFPVTNHGVTSFLKICPKPNLTRSTFGTKNTTWGFGTFSAPAPLENSCISLWSQPGAKDSRGMSHTHIPEQGMLTFPERDPRSGWHQTPRAELEPWTHTTSYGHHPQVWFSGCEERTGGPSCQPGSHLTHPTSQSIPANWVFFPF